MIAMVPTVIVPSLLLPDCRYESQLADDEAIVAAHVAAGSAGSALVVCYAECTAANGNGFVINQGSMIPWFAEALWERVKDLKN